MSQVNMNPNTAVLYVEDHPLSRKIMGLTLTGRMGLQHVTILEDSSDFLSRVQALEPKPDVIFLDIHVKPLNGFQMLEMLRATNEFSRTPVVALTASVMNEEIIQLQTAGFDGCIAKPIDLNTFASAFQQILAGEKVWRILDREG